MSADNCLLTDGMQDRMEALEKIVEGDPEDEEK